MHEPMVTITDFLITALALCFSYSFWKSGLLTGVRSHFFGLFLSVAAASFLGGLVHGFLPDASESTTQVFWVLTLLSVGVSAYNLWLINFHLLGGDWLLRTGRLVLRFMFIVYVLILLAVTQQFYIAIVAYIPAAFILFLLILSRVARSRSSTDLHGFLGLLLTFVAAYIQQAQIAIHPVYFNHNVFYHVVQAAGLYGLFIFGSRVGVGEQRARQ